MSLKHLFDAELRYRTEMAPIVATGEGELIGSGDGSVGGEYLEGTIRWTLFEQPGELVCGMNPVLVIGTMDGADIRVEARGFARRESRDDRRWRVAATLLFAAPDERYAWLDGALGVWEGESTSPPRARPSGRPRRPWFSSVGAPMSRRSLISAVPSSTSSPRRRRRAGTSMPIPISAGRS